MTCLHYKNKELYIEEVNLLDIAKNYQTPCYVYSRSTIESNWHSFDTAFSRIPHQICYAVKANSSLAILQILSKLGSGFDIVSLGELERVLAAGGNPSKVVFSGVGKTSIEIEKAIHAGIQCFDVESEAEIDRIQLIGAHLDKKIKIAIRINPNIDPQTHAHISTGLYENKFGIESSSVIPICKKIQNDTHLKLIGIACHIGSQIVSLEPFLLAVNHLLNIHKELHEMGIDIEHINIGGGLGITYHHEKPPSIQHYADPIIDKIVNKKIKLIIEPGRAIVGNAGVLLTKVEYLKNTKHKHFAIVDAGMNDFIRPALYDAWQEIKPVVLRNGEARRYDIAGPVCESADFIGKNRPLVINAGDLLAIDSVGAYGFSMSSNYNSRRRPPEILIDGDKTHLIRRRETFEDLFAAEKLI